MSTNETPTAETTSEETEIIETQTVEPTIEDLKKELEEWKSHSRTWETRAKENKSAADRIKEIEDANKSELEKAQERVTELEAELNSSKGQALRSNIIAEFSLDPEDAEVLLTATDEDGLRAQAARLAAKSAPKTPKVTANTSDLEGHPEPDPNTALAKQMFKF